MNQGTLEAKKAVIEEINSKIENAESVVVFEYQGLSVSEFEALRTELRKEEVEVKVYKNNLTRKAVDNTDYKNLEEGLTGPNAIAFSNGDAVAGPRIVSKFAKEHDVVNIKNGIIDGNVVDTDTIKEIASLPSREGLLSMLLSVLQAPVRDLAMITDAVSAKMEETGAETAAAIISEKTEQTEEAAQADAE